MKNVEYAKKNNNKKYMAVMQEYILSIVYYKM